MGLKYSTLEKTNALKIAKGAVAVLAKAYGFTGSDGPSTAPSIDNLNVLAVLGKITGEDQTDRHNAYYADPVWAVDAVLMDPGFALHYLGKDDSEVTREYVSKADALFCSIVRALLPNDVQPRNLQNEIENRFLEGALEFRTLNRVTLSTNDYKQYCDQAFGKERIMLAGSPQTSTGGDLKKPWVQGGEVKIEEDPTLADGDWSFHWGSGAADSSEELSKSLNRLIKVLKKTTKNPVNHHPDCIQRCLCADCPNYDGEAREGDYSNVATGFASDFPNRKQLKSKAKTK